jgi:acetylornithine/succinyldiaminopimelate/putrescine aminotransferase
MLPFPHLFFFKTAQGGLDQTTMNSLDKLNVMRRAGGKAVTCGLSDTVINKFAQNEPSLAQAIDAAYVEFELCKTQFPEIIAMEEWAQVRAVQAGFVNFYSDDNVNPYVAVAARGPWVVTLKGAVVHDSGGYGMLGFGHTPENVLTAMAKPQVMANIMTANLSQLRLDRALRKEIGRGKSGCPFDRFLAMNSGSESVTVAGRIIDVNTKLMTDAGGRYAGRKVKRIAVQGAFHGRTEFPALYSDSSRKTYAQHLASHKHHAHQLIIVEPYNLEQLREAFANAERDGYFIEAMLLEPVMGEGNPGRAVPPAFYSLARELTAAHGALFLVDSIQAGLRAHGCLSIVDYPGFENVSPPDMETYSKALNAGQYPLSILACNAKSAGLYRKGIYGNTMTTNPRAMDVAVCVLESVTPALRENIVAKGQEFLAKLEMLKRELAGMITHVQGTGLLFSCELSDDYKCYGTGSTEEFMRYNGIGVIHGGANSLRFTPHFAINSAEVDMVIAGVKHALLNGPRVSVSMAEPARAVA